MRDLGVVVAATLIVVSTACGGGTEQSGDPAPTTPADEAASIVDATTTTSAAPVPTTGATTTTTTSAAPAPTTEATTTTIAIEPVGLGEWVVADDVAYRAIEVWTHDPAAPRPGLEGAEQFPSDPEAAVFVVVDVEIRNDGERPIRTIDVGVRPAGSEPVNGLPPPKAPNQVAFPDVVLPGGVARDVAMWSFAQPPGGPIVLEHRVRPLIELELDAPPAPPTPVDDIEVAPLSGVVGLREGHTFGAADRTAVDYVAGIEVTVMAVATDPAAVDALVAENYRYPTPVGLAAVSLRFTAPPDQGVAPLRFLEFAAVDASGVVWTRDSSCLPVQGPILDAGASADHAICLGVPVTGITRLAIAPLGTSEWVLFEIS